MKGPYRFRIVQLLDSSTLLETLTRQKLKYPVVTCLRHFMLSPPFLYMIGLNALHHRTFSPIHYRKGGECMKCPKYITTGNSSFRPVTNSTHLKFSCNIHAGERLLSYNTDLLEWDVWIIDSAGDSGTSSRDLNMWTTPMPALLRNS